MIPDPTPREEVRQVLRNAGWQIDDGRPDHIEASDGEGYSVAVFFEAAWPVALEYGDSEQDLWHCEAWDEAPGVLSPVEVGRLFHQERGEEA